MVNACETGDLLLQCLLRLREHAHQGPGKYHPPVEPDVTDLPELPAHWTWASPSQLSSAVRHALAIGPFGSNLKVSDYQDEGVPLVFVRNIRSEAYADGTKFVSELKAKELASHTVDPGDILVTKMGEPPGDSSIYPIGAPQAVITADCIKWRVAPVLEPKFFMYALRSDTTKRQIAARTRGVAQKKISLERFRDLALPLPPLPEQRRIVARIEELFSRLDAGVAALRHAKAQLQRYRQSVLAAAVTGQLTQAWREQHPDAEPAEELLERILEQRREQWNGRGKYKEPSPPSSSPNRELPHTWTTASVAQLGEVVTGSTPSKGRADFYGGEFPFFKPTDLNACYFVREAREHLSELGAEHSRRLPAMSVLVTCIGATIGKTGLTRVEGTTNQQINTLTPVAGLSSEFVFWFFQSPDGQRGVIDNSSSTTLPILNKGRFSELPVPLPPLAEQQQIVAEVEARTTAIDHLEAELDRQITRAARLRQSTLAAAFAGKLP